MKILKKLKIEKEGRLFFVGDVHGEYLSLNEKLLKVNFNEDKDCVYLGGNKNVIQHFVDYQTTLGLSWARNYIFSHILSDELFSLQIDSHIRFDKNWDTTLLNMYYSTNDEFAIISHYPTGYDSQTEIKDPKQYTRFIH